MLLRQSQVMMALALTMGKRKMMAAVAAAASPTVIPNPTTSAPASADHHGRPPLAPVTMTSRRARSGRKTT